MALKADGEPDNVYSLIYLSTTENRVRRASADRLGAGLYRRANSKFVNERQDRHLNRQKLTFRGLSQKHPQWGVFAISADSGKCELSIPINSE